MGYKISIIIPVYNVEKYIDDCLNSILNQTFKSSELQVIMVNDGSTDNSKDIMDEYAKKYSNFTAIHLPKSHGGPGTARNEGMKLAKGEFLMFIDPDDFYDINACELMYNCMVNNNSEMVTCNYQNTNIEGKKWDNPIFDRKRFKSFRLLKSEAEYTKSFFVLCSSVCVKMFRREFVEKHKLKFMEGVPAEDALFTFSVLLKSSNVQYLDEVIYYYRQRNMENDVKSISWNCSENYFRRINKTYIKIYEVFEKAGRLDYYRYLYSKNLTYILYRFIDSGQISDESRKEILDLMHWFYSKGDILKVEPVQKSLKILVNKIIEKEYDEALDMCKIIQELRTYLPEKTKQSMSKPKEILYQKVEVE